MSAPIQTSTQQEKRFPKTYLIFGAPEPPADAVAHSPQPIPQSRRREEASLGGATGQVREPAVDLLLDLGLDGALVGLGDALRLEAVAEQRGRVHGALERVALPAEEVVSMLAVAGAVRTRG